MMLAPPKIALLAPLLLLLVVGSTHSTPCPARCTSCTNGLADCSSQSLSAPPRSYPADTYELDLSGNYIRVLGMRTFSNLTNLEVLKIPNNNIVSIRNDAFKSFPNLQTLDLTGNRIYRIYRRSLRYVSQLRTLTLNRNRIRQLSRIFDYVPNMFQLNLAHNKIRYIGQQDLAHLTQLRYIDFQDNKIIRIHKDAFKNLYGLRYLFLGRNPLRTLPALTWGSTVLHMLDISSCNLTAVPQPLPASVGDLRLGNNKITQIDHTAFINITDLKMLALNDNQLHFLADGTFSHLRELEEIWLRGNSLVYIPRNLPDNLRRLHMDSNNLQQIEADVFSSSSRMDFLTVEGNQLSRIAAGTFTGLRFLNTLNFQGNRIQEIESRALSHLGALSTLLLSNNPLQRIEDEAFHQLNNLSTLHMAHLTEEDFQLGYNFLPHMLRLQTLNLMNSPGLAQALLAYVDNEEESRDVMRYLTMLDLSYNNLNYLSPRLLVVFPHLTSAILEGNNFYCTQRLRWMGDWMREAGPGVTFGYYEEAVCQRPSRLRGRNVRDLADSDWAAENEIDAADRTVVDTANFAELQSDGGLEVYANAGWEAELSRDVEWNKNEKVKKAKKVKKERTVEEKKKREEMRKERRKRNSKLRREQKRKRKGKKGKDRKEKNTKGKGKRRNKDRKRKDRKGSGKGMKMRPTANTNIPRV